VAWRWVYQCSALGTWTFRTDKPLKAHGRDLRVGGYARELRSIVEKEEDGYYVGSVPELPSCHTQAKTLDELTRRAKEATELYLETEGTKAEGKIELVGVQFVEVSAN
jgi:predicted RNase H-like HicB family nuclease